MYSMDKNRPLLRTELVEAWKRFVDDTYTIEDLALLLNSVERNELLREFREVSDSVWNEAIANKPLMTEDRREAYEKKVYQLLDEYERKRIRIPSRRIVRFRKIWYAAAAAILLGLMIPAARLFVKPTTEQTEIAIHYIIEATGRGEIKTIVLPDQTKVTLNVESRLTYPDVFADERTVELQGEAIFDVTPDSERPFTVATAGMNVKVLGTVFDVKAYPNDETLLVSVASGKVEVTTTAAMGHAPLSQENPLYLEKNHQAKIDRATGDVEKLNIDAERYLSWTDGVLYFNKTPMKEIVNMLNRSYPRMVFELAEGEYPNLITGKFDTKEMAPMLGVFFKLFGIQNKKTGNKIILYNGNHENKNHQ